MIYENDRLCVKSVRIRRFSGPHYLSIFSPNARKYGPENVCPNTDIFHAVRPVRNGPILWV